MEIYNVLIKYVNEPIHDSRLEAWLSTYGAIKYKSRFTRYEEHVFLFGQHVCRHQMIYTFLKQ